MEGNTKRGAQDINIPHVPNKKRYSVGKKKNEQCRPGQYEGTGVGYWTTMDKSTSKKQ